MPTSPTQSLDKDGCFLQSVQDLGLDWTRPDYRPYVVDNVISEYPKVRLDRGVVNALQVY